MHYIIFGVWLNLHYETWKVDSFEELEMELEFILSYEGWEVYKIGLEIDTQEA